MTRLVVILSILSVLFISESAEARHRAQTYVDSNGTRRVVKTHKVYRDYKAVRDFKRTHPKPNDGHAYDVDHIKPLSQGGSDKPSNMQWIRTEDHRRKTARENGSK